MDTLLQDVRFAVRTLAKNRGFTTVAIVTLALGIGATTAIFSVINAVLVRPLGYPDPERLFVLSQLAANPRVGKIPATPLDFVDFRNEARSFASMAAYTGTGFTLTGEDGPELVIGQLVTAELFDVLGVRPLLGRTLRPGENEAGRDQVVVLGYELWQQRYGGDPTIVDRDVTINGRAFTVVGVMPPGFDFPSPRYVLWAPLALRGAAEGGPPINRNAHYLRVIGRLRDGATAEAASAELGGIARRIANAYPATNEGVGVAITPLRDEVVGNVRRALLLLFGAVGFVLLIACANVTNLLLARATGRHREMAIRSALGATRGRIIRQLFTENAVIYLAGAAAGIALARWGLELLIAYGPADMPRLATTSIDTAVLLFTLGTTLLTALSFGLGPAWHIARDHAAGWLRAGRGGGATPRSQHLRAALIVGEIALSVVLLAGAGLAIRSFERLRNTERGFHTENVLTFGVVMPAQRYPEAATMRAFHDRLIERLQSDAIIEEAGTTTHLPLAGNDLENSVTVDGVDAGPDGSPVAGLRGVGGDYFGALRIPVSGRAFTGADRSTSAPVAIINETFGRRFLTGLDPIGRRLKLGGSTSTAPWRTIVGVSGDVKHRDLAEAVRPEVYVPHVQFEDGFLQDWGRGLAVVVRSRADERALVAAVGGRMRGLDPNLPLRDLQMMRELESESVAEPRFRMMLLGAFGALALTLATVGVFGVMSYFVTQRTREIGIRMALGAKRADVLTMVLGRGAKLVGLGVTLGAVGAFGVTRSMGALLYEVSPTDPATFVGVVIVLTAAAMAATYVPAWRATRVEPIVALREE